MAVSGSNGTLIDLRWGRVHARYLYEPIQFMLVPIMHSLPTELLDHLCAFVAPSGLAVLSRASLAAHNAAQRVLYRHLALTAFAKNLACVFTLAANPRVASYVRSLAVTLRVPADGPPDAFSNALALAIANLSELTSLDLHVGPSASWVLRNDASYPRLQRFTCAFHLDSHLVHFLNKSISITELQIDSIPLSDAATLPLQPDALPILARFTGSPVAAQSIVPRRPVHYIQLNSGDLSDDLARDLALSTAPIQAFGANTSSHSPSLIATLTSCMPHLQHLRILTTFTFAQLPDISHFANITNSLSSLPHLKTCEIWGFHWISSKRSVDDDTKIWHSPSFNTDNLITTPTVHGNFLDNIYSDLIFPY